MVQHQITDDKQWSSLDTLIKQIMSLQHQRKQSDLCYTLQLSYLYIKKIKSFRKLNIKKCVDTYITLHHLSA